VGLPHVTLTLRNAKSPPDKIFVYSVVIGLVVFSVSFASSMFIFEAALDAQKKEVRAGLLRAVKVLAACVDPNAHRTFTKREDEDTALYKREVRAFEKIVASDQTVAYAWTAIPIGGKPYFIMDGTPYGIDEDGTVQHVDVMQEYTDPSNDAMIALTEKRIVVSAKPYTDYWGEYISAFVPLVDDAGEIYGTTSMDMYTKEYRERLKPVKRATAQAMILAFCVGFSVACAAYLLLDTPRVRGPSNGRRYR